MKPLQWRAIWLAAFVLLAVNACDRDANRSQKQATPGATAKPSEETEPVPTVDPALAHIAKQAIDPAAQMNAMAKAAGLGPEHQQLGFFTGRWEATVQLMDDTGQITNESRAQSNVAPILDARFQRIDHTGEMAGQKHIGQGLLGFDNLKGQYVLNWIDNMGTGIYLGLGQYDPLARMYEFRGRVDDAEVDSASYAVRQVFQLIDDNRYSFEWYSSRSGHEVKVMRIEYQRRN